MSDASNKEIFISLFWKEDFWSEAERMRSLNFTQRYSCEMFAYFITYVYPATIV